MSPSSPNVAYGSDSAVTRDDRYFRTWEIADISNFYSEIYPPHVGYWGHSGRQITPTWSLLSAKKRHSAPVLYTNPTANTMQSSALVIRVE
jgi:hypothetical protein